jgi:hypothetical protein
MSLVVKHVITKWGVNKIVIPFFNGTILTRSWMDILKNMSSDWEKFIHQPKKVVIIYCLAME